MQVCTAMYGVYAAEREREHLVVTFFTIHTTQHLAQLLLHACRLRKQKMKDNNCVCKRGNRAFEHKVRHRQNHTLFRGTFVGFERPTSPCRTWCARDRYVDTYVHCCAQCLGNRTGLQNATPSGRYHFQLRFTRDYRQDTEYGARAGLAT